MKKIIHAAVFLILMTGFIPATTMGQSGKEKTDSNTTVIVFRQYTSSQKKHKTQGESNIIKIAPLGFVSGTFPLLYERKVNDFFSVVASAGATGRNYSRALWQKDMTNVTYTYPWQDSNTDDMVPGIYDFTTRKAAPGYMLSLQPRLYFENDGLQGWFMGISYDAYRYNFKIPAFIATGDGYKLTGADQKEHENIADFMIHFGAQQLYDRLTFEYSTDIGLRKVTGTKYAASEMQGGYLVDGFATYKQTLFNFNIGIKVGYHF